MIILSHSPVAGINQNGRAGYYYYCKLIGVDKVGRLIKEKTLQSRANGYASSMFEVARRDDQIR